MKISHVLGDCEDFETELNKTLQIICESKTIIGIKYNSTHSEEAECIIYSALIMYK